jgi:uncharacterized protein with von Willebrand factor type A (vWA) domain
MNKAQDLIRNEIYIFRNTIYDCVWGDTWSAFPISTYNLIQNLLDSSMFESVHDLVDDSVRRNYE